jgi:hypothetical protein
VLTPKPVGHLSVTPPHDQNSTVEVSHKQANKKVAAMTVPHLDIGPMLAPGPVMDAHIPSETSKLVTIDSKSPP